MSDTVNRSVEAEANAVLAFWFEEVPPEKRFAKDDALDEILRERFSDLRDRLFASQCADWRGTPRHALAAVIVLDQFSRNIYRGSAEAFAADGTALDLALEALDKGWDAALPKEQRHFLYLPLMHAESAEMQDRSVQACATLGDPQISAFARDHRDVILRFGRFPSRNAALGRESTPEERVYLAQPGAGW